MTKGFRKQKHRKFLAIEWKRLGSISWLYIVLLIFLAVNLYEAAWFWNLYGGYYSYMADAWDVTGTQMGAEFDEKLLTLPEDEMRNLLIEKTSEKKDILEGYDTSHVAELLIHRPTEPLGGLLEQLTRIKYEKLQPVVDKLAETDASLSVFAAGFTGSPLATYFNSYLYLIFGECFVLGLLTSCFYTGWDGMCRTEGSVLGSRAGRELMKSRFLAGLCWQLIGSMVLIAGTMGIFSVVCPLRKIWDASMSSQFLGWMIEFEDIPFLTWIPFTFRGYTAAACLLGFVQSLLIYRLAYSLCLAVRGIYRAFLSGIAVCVVNLALVEFLLGDWYPGWYQLVQFLPFTSLHSLIFWFTDGLSRYMVPWQETWQTIGILVTAVLSGVISWKQYRKRDIV